MRFCRRPEVEANSGGGMSPRAQRSAGAEEVEASTAEEGLRHLMEGYQRGEPEAFDGLYSRLAAQLQRYLGFLSRDAGVAEDLTQESFLQIHRARHTYLPGRPVRPWAFAIARHVYKMHLRSRHRRQRHETRYPTSDSTGSNELARLALRETITRALPELAPEKREPLVLHHAFGFSFAEIGSLLGVHAGTAKLRAYRGLQQLREILGKRRRDED